MAYRIYLIPTVAITDPDDGQPVRVPKYLHNAENDWTAIPYGLEPVALCRVDVTSAEHTQLSGQADVTALPATLSNQVGAALATVQAELESLHIASDWVTSTTTYAEVVRFVLRVFQVIQRLKGRHGARLIESGITLDTRWNSLPQSYRDRIVDVAQSFGWSGVVDGNPQLRVVLRELAALWTGALLDEWTA